LSRRHRSYSTSTTTPVARASLLVPPKQTTVTPKQLTTLALLGALMVLLPLLLVSLHLKTPQALLTPLLPSPTLLIVPPSALQQR
jgi:hypothetical protein